MSDQLVIGGQLGNYLIDSVIGRGGMSVVYKARHSRLGTSVALKVLAPELSADDTFRERFLREAQMAAGVDHPNVIPIQDMGLHEDSLYIVMRYVSGGDLRALLNTSGLLEPGQALALLMPIARALDAAHAEGLVHRDVKPANILIQRSATGATEHVYLTDFGIAKSTSSSVSGLTRAGGMIGTAEYMAPEQMEGREVSARTDVYALATTFYECLTGRIPFQRELEEGVRPPVGPVPPVGSVRPEFPSALDAAIARALAPNPLDRYATCVEFLSACEQALGSREPGLAGLGAAPAPATVESDAVLESDAPPPPAAPAPPVAPPPAAPPPPTDPQHQPVSEEPGRRRVRARVAAGALLVVLIGGVIAVVVFATSSSTPAGEPSSTALGQVPTNHVTGSGSATVRLNGDAATVTVTTTGLDNDAALVHAMHIHAGGKGICPPASAARLHNGHLTISTTDGINYYGPPVVSLTTRGDTSPASILTFPRYLTGGNLRYSRTITVSPSVAAHVRATTPSSSCTASTTTTPASTAACSNAANSTTACPQRRPHRHCAVRSGARRRPRP